MTAQTPPSVSNYTIGKGRVYFAQHGTGGMPSEWAATTAYVLHHRIILPTGELLECSTAGTSGSSAPTVSGTTPITDGTAGWTVVTFSFLGNCPKLEFTADYDTIDHYSSQEGIKTRDLRVITNIRGGINITLDEITPDNLALGVIGGDITGSAGARVFNMLAGVSKNGVLKFVATNDVGPKYQYQWNNVSFTPSKTTGVISEEFVTLEMEAFVNKDGSGQFGTIREI